MTSRTRLAGFLPVLVTGLGFLLGLVILGRWDLEISLAIANLERTGFARFMQDYGMIPGFCVAGFGLICLTQVIPPLRRDALIRFGKIAVFTALCAFLVVMATKTLWGRVRFRDLEVNAAAFTQWFSPQGLTGNHSFPSGHTLWGALVWPLAWVIPVSRRRAHALLLLVLVAWGLAMAVARVLIGAHFVTDVVASLGVVTCALMLAVRLFPPSSCPPTSPGSGPRGTPGFDRSPAA